METINQVIQELISLGPDLKVRLLGTVVVVVALAIAQKLVARILDRRIGDVRIRYRWQKAVSYTLTVFGVMLVGRLWFVEFRSLATFAGLLTAGVAIALRDLLADLAGWFFILWRRPFLVGDRIEIAGRAGDVVDLRFFQFTLLEIGNWVDADQSTGRIIHVPNGKIFTEPLANFTQGLPYIWNELPVLVTFESDWRRAKEILKEIAAKHAPLPEEEEETVLKSSNKFLIFYSTLQPVVYTSVRDAGVMLTLRYICAPRRRRGTEEAIWEDILDAFARHDDIDFAYPTLRYYDNVVEGKVGARAPAT